MQEYYKLSAKDVIDSLDSNKEGISEKEAKERINKYGYNELPKENRFTALLIFLNQFKDALIMLLIFAGVLSFLLQENVEAIAIFAIIIINAILGFIQEYRAERAIEALEEISVPETKVLRSGIEKKISIKNIVPGDILLLEAGDIVPADGRIIELSSLEINEASLTGESVPARKIVDSLKGKVPISDQDNMVFRGTVVSYGKCKYVVTSTGANTELGKVAKVINKTEKSQTPLQQKFSQLARQIGIICIVLVIIVLLTGILRNMPFARLLLFSLALTVSTIPNSLPLVVTVGLSKGTKELAKKNMLVKKLSAAEGLGSATIICSDKTGTITKNQMTVTSLFFDNKIIKVTGSGYDPQGKFVYDGKDFDKNKLEKLLHVGYICNNAKLEKVKNRYEIIGDPTEGSLKVLGSKGGLTENKMKLAYDFIEELPFDSDRKVMSVIVKEKSTSKKVAYVKGAPDLLLAKCSRIYRNGKVIKLTKKEKENILKQNESFAKSALRVLAFAYKGVKTHDYSINNIESDLIFVGLTGMIDPPRDEVKIAISKCRDAGIKVMIITGDHAITTEAVASQIGLFEEGDLVLTGQDIDKMSDEELDRKIEKIRIVARALPIQKLRIVEALQKNGHIVAMTGDGVNDAPALKRANIGIAMGITGSDVAKEVSEAILTDDNFATIVNAIETGRNVFDKLIKSAKFFLSCNFGEITSVLIAIILGFPLPLLPLQILLMNMLTDNFPALGLGFESSEEGIMQRPPRDPDEKPLNRKTLSLILIFGLIMGLGTLFMFVSYKDLDLAKAQTVAFTTLVMFQMFAVLSSRTLYPSLRHLNPFTNLWLTGAVLLSVAIQVFVIYNPFLQRVFGTTSLTGGDWLGILGISLFGFILMELSKLGMKINLVSNFTSDKLKN